MFDLDSFGPWFWLGFLTWGVGLSVAIGIYIWRLPRRFVRCEDCHCTEARACHGGCAWNLAYLELGRYVCTACRPAGEGP